MKKKLSSFMLVLVFLLGLSLLLYPSFSNYWNSMHQSRAIAGYAETVALMKEEGYDELWKAAHDYNTEISRKDNPWAITEEEHKLYNEVLNISGTGIMGYIEIPGIHCSLPIYHSTEDHVLQSAVGHLEGSSLPVGGSGTHCVLSGHRGLPSAKLFTDLDQMVEGDLFYLQILDETLTYEVEQILIVLPHEVDTLRLQEGKDLCTLVTCTPYGVNSHRLLVRGRRIENIEEEKVARVTADAVQIKPVLVAPFVALPILLILLGMLLFGSRKR